jgi:diphthine-ammonia ligase
MKFVALISGGKDSIYSILESHRQGHELVACVHLARPVACDEDEESYMYQTAASETIKTLVEDCLDVPLIFYIRKGKSLNTSLVYQETTALDEVEDLYHALRLTKERFTGIEAVASGAILSTYQRVRVENVCSRLDLTSLAYLWRRASQSDLLQNMLDDGITAVLVRTAAPPGLSPRRHLNRTLQELQGHFQSLHDRCQFHVCGEGGEFETLCLDSPIHRKRLVLDEVEIIEAGDGTGELLVRSCHAEAKAGSYIRVSPDPASDSYTPTAITPTRSEESRALTRSKMLQFLPHVRNMNGGLLHFSELVCPELLQPNESQSEADLAVLEVEDVLTYLERALIWHGCTAMDVVMVHLYLSEMSHFFRINERYRKFFGVTLPPSRSCVSLGRINLPNGRRVLLDCVVQRGSGMYMRTLPSDLQLTDYPVVAAAHATTTSRLREVLHVQSRSHWAPVCVGPYSQTNTLRSVVHFLAGQIGLIPASMTLRATWQEQVVQAWRNTAQILDALDEGSMDHLLSGLIYVEDSIGLGSDVSAEIETICREEIYSNSGVVPGAIERGQRQSEYLDGYEDEATMLELSPPTDSKRKAIPLLAVSISAMPLGALVEIEVIAATSSFVSCVEMVDFQSKKELSPTSSQTLPSLGWDTGHSFVQTRDAYPDPQIEFDLFVRSMGSTCIACATITACVIDNLSVVDIEAIPIFEAMLSSLYHCQSFNMASLLNMRVYYIGSMMDGAFIRSAFHAAASRAALVGALLPAITFVPVTDMRILMNDALEKRPVIAFQANSLDVVKAETCRWIHRGR